MKSKSGPETSPQTGNGDRLSVVISGMPSVGKTTAAETISRKFRLRHFAGGDMLREIAREHGYRPRGSDWWDGPEGMSFLSQRRRNPRFDKEVDRRLVNELKKGGVVITSYTVPWLDDRGLKIWLKASKEARARRLAGRDSLSVDEAKVIIDARDRENKALYKKLYGIRFGSDLSVFNYVVDTEDIPAANVAESVCKLVGQYKSSFLPRPRRRR